MSACSSLKILALATDGMFGSLRLQLHVSWIQDLCDTVMNVLLVMQHSESLLGLAGAELTTTMSLHSRAGHMLIFSLLLNYKIQVTLSHNISAPELAYGIAIAY